LGGGGGISVLFGDLPFPVANQLYRVRLGYIALWFAANKFDLPAGGATDLTASANSHYNRPRTV